MPISTSQLDAALQWRYAVKVFDPGRSIDPSTWACLENSLAQSPSSYGLQPWPAAMEILADQWLFWDTNPFL